MKANGQEQGIKITLGGKEHTLIFDYNAICAMEQQVGTKFYTEKFFDAMTPAKQRLLLWACLVAEEPELTLYDVGRMMQFSDLTMVRTKVSELLTKIVESLEVMHNPAPGQPSQPKNGTTLERSPDTT